MLCWRLKGRWRDLRHTAGYKTEKFTCAAQGIGTFISCILHGYPQIANAKLEIHNGHQSIHTTLVSNHSDHRSMAKLDISVKYYQKCSHVQRDIDPLFTGFLFVETQHSHACRLCCPWIIQEANGIASRLSTLDRSVISLCSADISYRISWWLT